MARDFKFIVRMQIDHFQKAYRKATSKWLNRVGGYVRKVARNSLKRAKSQTADDMSYSELIKWMNMNDARQDRKLAPLGMPDQVSKPGQPPLLHSASSPLKHLLLYATDVETSEAVIGPMRAKSAIAGKLEHGSGKLRARPFMAPAQTKTLPYMATWWANSIT